MVVLGRLVWALFRGFFKRKIEPLGTSIVAMRVWPNDLDLNVHMNSGRYQSLFDVGRMELLVRMRLLRKVLGRGWRPVAASTTIQYRKSLLPFERFTIESRVVCWDEKWFYFEHVMKRKGEVAAVGYVRGLMRGPDGNVRPSEFLALAGTPELPSPPMPDFVRQWAEAFPR